MLKRFTMTAAVLCGATLAEAYGVAVNYQRLCVRAQTSRSVMASQALPQFAILAIPTPGGKAYHGAADINDGGQVVGSVLTANHKLRAFLWQQRQGKPGQILFLGNASDPSNSAWAINNHTQVAGRMETSVGERAFLWENGQMRDLGVLPGFTRSAATGINNRGQVVGRISRPTREPYWRWPAHAVLWQHGHLIDLGVPGGCLNSQASAINDVGQVVGRAVDGNEHTHAILWDRGRIVDLGAISHCPISSAAGINNHGQIIGTAGQRAGDMRTVIWERGPAGRYCARWLKALPFHTDSIGAAITEDGAAYANAKVGWEYVPAVMWNQNAPANEARELQTRLPADSGWYVRSVFAANSRGQVLAFAYYRDQEEGLALLTPRNRITP